MKKLALLTAIAVGYVLGTRAGRGRYEQIKQQAEKVWNTDPVQATAQKAQDTAQATAADVGHRVAETAKDVSSVVADKVKTAADFSKEKVSGSDDEVKADDDAAAPSYSTSAEGLRAGAAEADARAAFDIDEAGSDDLATGPNPLSDAEPTEDPRA